MTGDNTMILECDYILQLFCGFVNDIQHCLRKKKAFMHKSKSVQISGQIDKFNTIEYAVLGFFLFVRNFVWTAADVNIGKAGFSPLFLFRDPCVYSDLFHSFTVGEHGNVTLRKAQNTFAGVFGAEGADFDAFSRGAFSNGAKRRAARSFPAAAPRFGFCKHAEIAPELVEIGHAWPPVLDRLFS
jgi:hypothetical protein